MKRILFISLLGKSESAGCELLWSETADQLLRRGVQVTASVWEDYKPMARHLQRLQQLKADIYIRENGKSKIKFLTRLVKWILKKIGGLPEDSYAWISKGQPDLVVITQPINMDGLEFMAACDRLGIPYAPIAHAAAHSIWLDDHYLDRLRLAFNKAKKCFFVSEANLELTQIQLGGIRLENAEVVRNPFNVNYDAQPEWPAEEVYRLLCLGRLEPYAKGQDILFQVMNMQKWRDRPIELVCVGAGNNAKTVEQLVRFFDLQNTHVLPFEEDVERLWASYHALVLPSRHEGLPMVIVEAMLCGRICIVTDIAGNKELLEDGQTGFIAKAPTVELLDEAMERAWQKRHQWQEMGQRAAVAVRKEIPREPAHIFCDTLLKLMELVKKKSGHEYS